MKEASHSEVQSYKLVREEAGVGGRQVWDREGEGSGGGGLGGRAHSKKWSELGEGPE